MPHENHQRLHDAGLIDMNEVPQAELDKLESLSSDEIDALLSIKEKLGFQGKLTGPDTSIF